MSKGREGPAAGGGAAAAILLRYLREQNRPYSAQDAFGNLQREHGLGKAAVVKALEQLAQQGRVREKAYGKQKIYFADQEQLPAASESELRGLDGEIAALCTKVQALQQSCRQMEAELKDLNSSMTTPEIAREIEELRKDCTSYAEKLERIKSAANHVTPEEKEKVKSCQGLSGAPAAELGLGLGQLYQTLRQLTWSPVQLIPVQGVALSCLFLANLCFGQSSATWSIHLFLSRVMRFAERFMSLQRLHEPLVLLNNPLSPGLGLMAASWGSCSFSLLSCCSQVCSEQKLYCKEWRRRKRMATELLEAILEGYPKSKKQFFEEVGIETDEDHNVTLPAAV
ncbi:homologous-pairing protein 2 homolog isoform 1-T1 [Morphnus guianensis]